VTIEKKERNREDDAKKEGHGYHGDVRTGTCSAEASGHHPVRLAGGNRPADRSDSGSSYYCGRQCSMLFREVAGWAI